MRRKNYLRIISVFFGLAAAGFFILSRPLEASELVELTSLKTDSALEINILIRGEYSNEIFKLAAPDRLVLDISPIDTISIAPEIEINASGVLKIRVGRYKPDVARIVFDLETPVVNYKIEKSSNGLKISFWKESPAAVQPEEKVEIRAEEKAEIKTGEKTEAKIGEKAGLQAEPEPAKTVSAEERVPEGAAGKNEREFFVQLGGGLSAFLSSGATFSKTFSFYERPAPATENDSLKRNTPAELSFGKYFWLDNILVKAGLGIEYWDFKIDGDFTFSIPSPIVLNTPRTATAARRFRTRFTAVSAFGLFRIFESDKWTLLAGPEIGIAVGECTILKNITIEDKPPYTDADLTLTSITYEKKNVSSLRAGLRASLEYALSKKFALALNIKAFYFSPEIKDRTSKFDLSQAEALLGIQYGF